ncbi:MAG: hypothetical protein AAF798_01880 [Bacteroidota bacterium]
MKLIGFTFIPLHGQVLTGLATQWNDDLSQWYVYTDEEDVVGELRLRWPQQQDWTQWEFRMGELAGSIRLKWRENPNEWEIRVGNQVATARTVLNNRFREWRIFDGTHQFTLLQTYGNSTDEWKIRPNKWGTMDMITTWQNDPRDWEIYDELDEAVQFPIKLAIVFIGVVHSIRR